MGTVFSRLATPPNVEKAFATYLRDAIEESVEASNSKSGPKRKYTEGVLGRPSAVSISNSEYNGRSMAEGLVSPLYKQASSGMGMTMNSKNAFDVNKNPTRQEPSKGEFVGEQNGQQNSPQKPFKPDSWPTLEMIETHLSKHYTYCLRPPTTLIFARFLPNRDSKKYVEIRYSTTENPEETILESSDKLETLISPKDEFKKGDTLEEDAKYFLLIFKTCINHLQGQVWWNGFSFTLDPNVKARLKVSALETQPISQLLFELTGMKELQVRRTLHRMELRGQVEGSTDNASMYIRFRGIAVRNIKVKQLRSNLITVHIPGFSTELIGY